MAKHKRPKSNGIASLDDVEIGPVSVAPGERVRPKAPPVKEEKYDDSDDAVRFWKVNQKFEDCYVKVVQIYPHHDDSIEALSMRLFKGDFHALQKRVRDTYWKGETATYSWKCYDRSHPTIAKGEFSFNERGDDDMTRHNAPPGGGYPPQYPPQQQPPQYAPQYQQPPYNPYPPPQYAPPQYQPAPQQHYQQPPPDQVPAQVGAPPHIPPPPAPPPIGADPQLLNAYLQLAHAHAALMAQQYAHAPQQGYYPPPGYPPPQQPVQGQPVQHPVAAPEEQRQEKPKEPTQVLNESLQGVLNMFEVGQKFASKFNQKIGADEVEEPAKPKEDDKPFPVQTKDFGSARLLAVDGELVDSFWPNAFANSDKAVAIGNTLIDKIGGIFSKFTEGAGAQKKDQDHKAALERAQKKVEFDERTAQAYERAAAAQREIRANAVQQPSQIVVVESAPQASPTQQEPEPEPHPIAAESEPESVVDAPPNGTPAE